MNKFIKMITSCFGINYNKSSKNNYSHLMKYQPEGNRFIYNKDL